MKYSLLLAVICMACTSSVQSQADDVGNSEVNNMITNFYDLSFTPINGGETVSMSAYKGKKILIVNVASKCGYTPQYEGLQELYETYGEKLVVLGFPCNQFMGQEPGDESEIESFCKLNYGVTFPLSEKVDVRGNDQHPVYQWLTHKEMNGKDDHKISWNFNKFLISEDGQLLAYFGSNTKPMSEEITSLL